MEQDRSAELKAEMERRRGTAYPAHAFIAEHFPDYLRLIVELDEEIRVKERIFDERMHELFHILALAVSGSNPHNQPHLTRHMKKGLKLGLRPEEIAEAICFAASDAVDYLTGSEIIIDGGRTAVG